MEDHMLLDHFMCGGMAISVRKQKKIQLKILRENGDLAWTTETQPGAGMKNNIVWRRAVISRWVNFVLLSFWESS